MIKDQYAGRTDLSPALKHYYRNRETLLERKRNFKISCPEMYILNGTRSRAKDRGIDFDLDIGDIKIPEVCPILKIPLKFSRLRRSDSTPSVDRIDNSLGYVKKNIKIISWRANRLKNNMNVKEVKAILKYMEDNEVSPRT